MFSFLARKEVFSHVSPPISFIKERARILFLDDQEVPLVDTLIAEGWHVEYWSDVKSLRDLEQGKFDIIFLDIGGVGREFAGDKEGIGILQRLKSVNPAVVIIAYSGQSFDIEKTEFFQLADDYLTKSAGAIRAIEIIERRIPERWTIARLWQDLEVTARIAGAQDGDVRRLKKQVEASIRGKAKLETAKTTLNSIFSKTKEVGVLFGLANEILDLLAAVGELTNG